MCPYYKLEHFLGLCPREVLGAIKTTQLFWSLNWASPSTPRRKGQKWDTDALLLEQPQIVPALSQRLMSWPHPDTTNFLLPCVVAKRKISDAPFLLLRSTSPFACAFKPWALLNTVTPWCHSDCSVSFLDLVSVSPSPHLVLRRRSPRDPWITGPAGRANEFYIT